MSANNAASTNYAAVSGLFHMSIWLQQSATATCISILFNLPRKLIHFLYTRLSGVFINIDIIVFLLGKINKCFKV